MDWLTVLFLKCGRKISARRFSFWNHSQPAGSSEETQKPTRTPESFPSGPRAFRSFIEEEEGRNQERFFQARGSGTAANWNDGMAAQTNASPLIYFTLSHEKGLAAKNWVLDTIRQGTDVPYRSGKKKKKKLRWMESTLDWVRSKIATYSAQWVRPKLDRSQFCNVAEDGGGRITSRRSGVTIQKYCMTPGLSLFF